MVHQAMSLIMGSARNMHARATPKPELEAISAQVELLEADLMAVHQAFMPEGTLPRTNAAIIDNTEVEDARYSEVRHTLANILMRYAAAFGSSFADMPRKQQQTELRNVSAAYDVDMKQNTEQKLVACIDSSALEPARKAAAQQALAAFFTHHTVIADTAKSLIGGRGAAIGLVS